MRDWKLTTDFRSLEQMVPEFSPDLKDSKNCILLNGNLMKQVYYQSPTLRGSQDLKFKIKLRSRRNSSNMAKEERIQRSSKWWENKWLVPMPKKVQKKLIWSNTKNYRSNKLQKHNRLFNLKQLQAHQAWMLPLPKITRPPLEQELPLKAQYPESIKKLTNPVRVLEHPEVVPLAFLTGDLETFMINTMTINSKLKILRQLHLSTWATK